MSITKDKKHELINQYSIAENDTGSVEVQCAILTSRILSLTEHFKVNKKDFQSRRGLLVMVNKRRRLLEYLKSNDAGRHQKLIERLGLRK
jgi:small subunit ribosomal protein S15